MEFKIGDVVQLKSGGPRMTVDHIDPHGAINCIWFQGQERKSAAFQPATLKSGEIDYSAAIVASRRSPRI
jgi:uncharacterized protein YodC (DUF2158 family)